MGEVYSIKKLYDLNEGEGLKKLESKEIVLRGLVKSNRIFGDVGFIALNDGSCFSNCQIVYKAIDNEAAQCRLGYSITVTGKIKSTPENKQPFELEAKKIEVLCGVTESFPLQKKKTSFDFLRDYPQYRMKTNTFNAVFRVRSTLSYYINEYFHKNGFYWIHTPILTANDCEGAGQTFDVIADRKHPEEYFNNDNVHLTVSGQLHEEPFALMYQKCYTFGPTFRAEKSNTVRHAAEFWMIEPEVAFANLSDIMDLQEDFLKYVVSNTIKDCKQDMEFFYSFVDKDLKVRLENFINKPFVRLKYEKAVEILQKAVKDGVKFDEKNIYFGLDFHSEHERYLTEKVYNCPVFLTDYPKEIKAFYMTLNEDNKTVAAADLLVPFIGELCGGSQREVDYKILEKRMKELNMNLESYQWYLDLRANGSMPHSGFGLGFERLVMLVTGMTNIRDVLPYPRCYKDMKF